jgi:peptidyl-dipeptidase A
MRKILTAAVLLAATALLASCAKPEKKAQAFVDTYTVEVQKLSLEVSEAEWASNTHIVEGDTTNAHRSKAAKEAYAVFTGNAENIATARKFLEKRDKLSPLLVRQLELILYEAGGNPQTVADIVKRRIKVETEQVEKLYGFDYQLDGKSVSTNDIDRARRSAGTSRTAWSRCRRCATRPCRRSVTRTISTTRCPTTA